MSAGEDGRVLYLAEDVAPLRLMAIRANERAERAEAALAPTIERAVRAELALVIEKQNNVAITESAMAEIAELHSVNAGLCYRIAKQNAELHELAWARWLVDTRWLIAGGLVLLGAALTAPRVRHVGRRVGPSDGQLAAVAGVLVAIMVIALVGLGGGR